MDSFDDASIKDAITRAQLASQQPAPEVAAAPAAPEAAAATAAAPEAATAAAPEAMGGIARARALLNGALPSPNLGVAADAVQGTANKVLPTINKFLAKTLIPASLASTAVNAYNTPTEVYDKRFGFGPSDNGALGLVEDVGKRALGAASDLGNAMTLGLAGKLYRDKQDPPTAATTPSKARMPVAAAQPQAAPVAPISNPAVSSAPTIAAAVAPVAPVTPTVPDPQYTLGQNATEVIRPGGDRTVSLFSAGANGGTSEVPGDVYDAGSGKIAQYQAAQAQKQINVADPLAATTASDIAKETVRNAGMAGVANINQGGETQRFRESTPQQLGDFQIGILKDLSSGDADKVKAAQTRQQAFQQYSGALTLKDKMELYNHYLAAAGRNLVETPLTMDEWSSKLAGIGQGNTTGAAAPAMPPNGTKSTSGGKPIVVKNGKWELVK